MHIHFFLFLVRYFEWIANVQRVLKHWNKKFQTEEVHYDEIMDYASHQATLVHLGTTVCAPQLVVDCPRIEYIKTIFRNKFELLNSYLIKYIPGKPNGHWCNLPSLLADYGVALPQTAQDFILKKVSFPGQGLIRPEQLGKVPICPNKDSLFLLGHDLSLRLHKSSTLRELGQVLMELELFQQPLLDHLVMLVFFKLNNSTLFDKCLRFNLKKITDDQHEPKEIFSTNLSEISFSIPFSPSSFSPRSVSHAPILGLPMSNLVRALSDTRALVYKIMLGTATYSEIIADDEGMLQCLDIEQEFSILQEYGLQSNMTGNSCEGLDGVRSMLELFQYSTHINNIRSVCEQYKTLEGCCNDPRLMQLTTFMEDHVKSEDRSKLTPLEAMEKMRLVKEILCLWEKKSSKCLNIFAAMSYSAAFYQFVRDKQFYGQQGQVIFRQQYELITAQLQHEEYNESVLNHLLVAFKIITIFMDSKKNFTELMQELMALNVAHGFKELDTVNSNITLIRLWFSKAEVRVELCVCVCVCVCLYVLSFHIH